VIGGQGGADGSGGFGGGGDGASGLHLSGAGGGGATRISLDGVPLMVAAGGGGASYGNDGGRAGQAANQVGFANDGQPGTAGSLTTGGAGGDAGMVGATPCQRTDDRPATPSNGSPGLDGVLGQGGKGGAPGPNDDPDDGYGASDGGGGGGGGGYYGGGGGGGASYCPWSLSGSHSAAGGGGSSYVDPRVTDVSNDVIHSPSVGLAEVVYNDTVPPAATPTLSPPANAAGWNNTNVRLDWNWHDDLAGINPQQCQQKSLTVDGGGTYHFAATCTDFALNEGYSGVSVRVDKKAPRVRIFRPRHKTYKRGATVLVSFSCYDWGSGMASCHGSQPNHHTLSTRRLGRHRLTVRGRDLAGSTRTRVVTYRVVRRQP